MNLVVLTGVFPPDTGGPATYVPRIASALVDRGWSVEVITAGEESAEEEFPFSVSRVPRSAPGRLAKSVPLVRNRLHRADLVYVNGLELDYVLAAVGDDTPSVLKVVGDRSWEKYQNRGNSELAIDEFQSSFPGFRTWLERGLHRTVSRRFDRYIVPSRYLKSLIEQWGVPEETVSVIHNHSLPPADVTDEPLEWPNSGRRLLTVGRLVPWKNVEGILEALTEVPRAGLVVLGDGPQRRRIEEERTTLNLERRVVLKGNVSRESVWNHLGEADELVLNSSYEGFPHVLLESVEVGTPALARSSGGSAELAGYFPGKIRTYDGEPGELRSLLREPPVGEDFASPELPSPLRWETIVDSTAEVLREAAQRG